MTFLNMTSHAYFNLAGHGHIFKQKLWIPAIHMLETDREHIPTGNLPEVGGTPFDFTTPTELGKRIGDPDPNLLNSRGYNHCYVLTMKGGQREISHAARLSDPVSGRKMDVFTDLPGLLVYTGNYLGGGGPGKHGNAYEPYQGVCLEAQYFPDTPHHPHFPSCRIDERTPYRHQIRYRF